jgi:hypothetical protein
VVVVTATTIDRPERLEQLVETLLQQVEELNDHLRPALNESYEQGVRDARKRRTGVDPAVDDG